MLDLSTAEGFDWDQGNRNKNWLSHKVKSVECEMVFFNEPLILFEDEKHSQNESRYHAFGKTDVGRRLLLVFCLRDKRIRIISARDMNRKEKKFYEEQEKKDTQL